MPALLIAGLVLAATALPVGTMFALHLHDDSRVEHTFEQRVEDQSRATQSLWGIAASQLEIIKALARQPISPLALQGGLPMPEKPEANWARCQNECGRRNQPFCIVDGQPVRGVTGIRGVCWRVTVNATWLTEPPTRQKCSGYSYDPPPESPPDRRDECYDPVKVTLPKSLEPGAP